MSDIDQVADMLGQTLPPLDNVKQEYAEWIQCSPFLYDYLQLHELECNSSSVQWFAGAPRESKGCTSQKLIISTNAPENEDNYMLQLSLHFPDPYLEVDLKNFDENGATKKQKLGVDGHIKTEYRIYHPGPILKLRYCPQMANIIATASNNGNLYLFNLENHPSSPISRIPNPQYCLQSHHLACHAVEWSPLRKGCLASGSDDQSICIWDILSPADPANVQPIHVFEEQKGKNIAWSLLDCNLIGTCGSDGNVFCYDIREAHSVCNFQAHTQSVNDIAYNPVERQLFATCSDDQTIALWDERNTSRPLHSLIGHSNSVISIQWNPFNACVLASTSWDHHVNIWDISRVGMILNENENEKTDGPAELLFIHGGHRAIVNDVSWNPNDEWTLASVGNDRLLELWHPSHSILDRITYTGIAL